MTLAGTCWAERTWNRAFPDMSSSWRNHLCECEAGSDVLMAYQTSKGDLCGGFMKTGDLCRGMKGSVRVFRG